MYMEVTPCMDLTSKTGVHENYKWEKNRIWFPFSVWHPSPTEHLAIYCSFPPTVTFLKMSHTGQADPPHSEHKTRKGSFPKVCSGTSSSWCGSSISGASLAHLPMETAYFGEDLSSGFLPQTQFLLYVISDSWMLKVPSLQNFEEGRGLLYLSFT